MVSLLNSGIKAGPCCVCGWLCFSVFGYTSTSRPQPLHKPNPLTQPGAKTGGSSQISRKIPRRQCVSARVANADCLFTDQNAAVQFLLLVRVKAAMLTHVSN